MKTFYFFLSCVALCLFSSFTTREACSYASSNMSYAQSQTVKALTDNNLNKAKFFTYKAIKSIQASKGKFNDCGCVVAETNISESLINLKAATKATSLNGSRVLLEEALQHIIDTLYSLSRHETHEKALSSKEFALNTALDSKHTVISVITNEVELHKRIDTSLLKYKASLKVAVDSLQCKDVRVFADRIFQQCEQQLLKNNLSEAKKYYNLRTKEITEKALMQLGDCGAVAAK